MGVVQDLVTEITAEGGFEVTPGDALKVLDRRHKMMCRRARWHRRTVTAVAGTASGAAYSTLVLPQRVTEAFSISFPAVEDGPVYTRGKLADRGAMLGGTLILSGRGGVFVESPSNDETDTTPDTQLVLYPAVTAGDTAFIEGAFEPPTLTTAETGGAFVRVPDDFHEALLAGVYASLLNRPGEARPDLAATHEQVFVAGCQELRQLADQRFRARGPRQIRIVGQNI